MAHLVAALKYIELGNYTANQLLIPFMIARSNILNEIFRGKFSHNRDHCSPPPAAGPCKGGWQLGAALELGLTGQNGKRAPGFLVVWGLGMAWGQRSQSPLARLEGGAPRLHTREGGCGYAKGESRQLLMLQVAYFDDSFGSSVFRREAGTQ